MERPPITPDMKVGELLDAYPELEEILIEIAPTFKKLHNPVLRRTVAKITSLRQAAEVGGVSSLGEMIGKLRNAVGCHDEWQEEESGKPGDEKRSGSPGEKRPDWLEKGSLVETFDAIELIESGGHPVSEVIQNLKKLGPGERYALITSFKPAPLIDKAAEAGYPAYTEKIGDERFKTTFRSR